MKSIKTKNYLIYLFWLGPFLTIMGLTAGVVTGDWSPVALGLLFAGLAIIGFWLLFLGALSPGFWKRRSTQAGTNALVATLAMLVILGLINFLGVRYAQRLDLTETQLFTLSPLSQRVVKNLQQPVKIWLFDPKPNPVDRDLLNNYRRHGNKLEYEFADPQLRPTIAQKFKVQKPGEVYLEYGLARKFLQTVSDAERLSEVKLTNGIEQLTSDRTDTAYFLQGHGERPLEQVEGGLSEAVGALKEKNLIAQPLNLAERSEVPDDASLVVVAGPKRALFPGEAQALRNYLTTGGSVLLMVDPEANPGLDNLLTDWGVKLERQIVIDASGQGRSVGLGPATPVVSKYGNHPITRDFGSGFSFYPLARPIESTPLEGVQETPLVVTTEKSWGESNPENQPLQFDPKSDRPGPITVGVALSRKAQPASPSPTPSATTTSPSPTPSATTTSPSPTPSATTTSPSPTPSATTTSPSPTPSATTTSPSPTSTPQAKASPSASPTSTPQATTSPSVSPTPSASPSITPTTKVTTSPSSTNQEKNTKKTSEARLIVYGNSNFATDGWFKQQLNGDVFLNSVSWLSKRDEQALSIRPKEQKNRRINLSTMQAGGLGWVTLLVMPLIGFTTAGIMWWRRR
ncbi:MAG TPA: Gldg family protein [Candidatus Sericytochromatia bacterium]